MTRYLIPVSLAASFLLISSVGISQAQPLPAQQNAESKVAQATTQQGNQSVPAIIDEGFEAYRTQGIIAASEVWLQNSLDYLRNQGAVVANQLAGDLQGSGAYLGYSVLYSTSVTENTQIVYIESQYEHGTAFWKFVVSTHNGESTVTDFLFNSDPTDVLPDFLIFRE